MPATAVDQTPPVFACSVTFANKFAPTGTAPLLQEWFSRELILIVATFPSDTEYQETVTPLL